MIPTTLIWAIRLTDAAHTRYVKQSSYLPDLRIDFTVPLDHGRFIPRRKRTVSLDFLRPTRSASRPRDSGITALAIVAVLLCIESGTASEPRCSGLQVEPRAIMLHGGDTSQQVSVTVLADDGSTSDVTPECRYVVVPDGVADVSPSGFVRPKADGRAMLRISLGRAQAEVEVCVTEAAARRPVSFRNDVAPVFSKAGCNAGACHGNSGGKGGFRLSLRGDDPGFDYLSITREALGRRVSPGAPERSLILLKPTGQVPHEGGQRFAARFGARRIAARLDCRGSRAMTWIERLA